MRGASSGSTDQQVARRLLLIFCQPLPPIYTAVQVVNELAHFPQDGAIYTHELLTALNYT